MLNSKYLSFTLDMTAYLEWSHIIIRQKQKKGQVPMNLPFRL